MTTREEAKRQRTAAFNEVSRLLHASPVSVGVAPMPEGGWGLKINLAREPSGVALPERIAGVPTRFVVTGRVSLL